MIRLNHLLLAAVAGLFLATAARADDKPKDLDKIPKAVMDALKAKFPGFEIVKWTQEKEGNVVLYDIEGKIGGKKAEADIKEDGTIMNYEREFDAKDLPAAVKEAVEKKYPKATMKEVLEITEIKDKQEKKEGFEIVLETADKKEVELTISPEGKILEDSTEEKKKEEKKDKP